MAFVDEIVLYAEAGRGGDGVVRWLHEKGKEFSGAAGGNGGRGGDVYVKAVRDIQKLNSYQHDKRFIAGKGVSGMRNSKTGKDGADIIIELPVGSIITNKANGKKYNVTKEGEQIFLLKGGRGGLGNEHFKASTNTTPYESTPGKEGEKAELYVELELVADAGLIGLPNAGKSSLLNELTNSRSKVGAFAFTTLEPALGNMEGYIVADIPGLIEGASTGKGLGVKFLRHIRRTKALFHCISLEHEDLFESYKIIRAELKAFDSALAEKQEVVVLTKTDVTTEDKIKEAIKYFKKLDKEVFTVTALDDASVKTLKDNLIKFLRVLG